MGGRIIMPEPNYRDRNVQNHRNVVLVPKYGEATVRAAELSVVLELFIMVGIVRPHELIELVDRQCQKIENERREQARLDSDR